MLVDDFPSELIFLPIVEIWRRFDAGGIVPVSILSKVLVVLHHQVLRAVTLGLH